MLAIALQWVKLRDMHAIIASKRQEIADLCRRFAVARLEAFGSAARGKDFDSGRSDADFLVVFPDDLKNDLVRFEAFREALETELGRPVDLVEREAVERSRNPIRRKAILREAELVFG
jgi:predicted nucleotidyltransferase